ncbi:hypothetical protein KV205_35505 [Streptomyces sp. SKN60]|uniref:hypothetical protein n=1 Tax=Streptomyces sp. SKN60 TaxID=2855506 RepID=UPI0022459435|nr:hypothetical protein [Streptomyces sp. SKN60]MCX2185771.1 hypothetical protein [Streptomyces sp. SKN60]
MTTTPHFHPDVAGYVLSVLDTADTEAFEEHLLTCHACVREGELLGDTAMRLHALTPPGRQGPGVSAVRADDAVHGGTLTAAEEQAEPLAAAIPSKELLPRILQSANREKNKSRRRSAMWGLAAAGAIIAGPLATLAVTSDRAATTDSAAASAPALAGQVRTVRDTDSGVTATAGIQGKGWGSAITVRLSGVTGPERCRLMAIGKDGSAQPIGYWSVPATGYGTPEHPESLSVNAATDLTPDQLARLEVRTTSGRTLATIPV